MLKAIKAFLTNFVRKATTYDSAQRGGFTSFVDAYRKQRIPTEWELLQELKLTAWTCATINSSVTADFPPKLYVRTFEGQKEPRVKRKSVDSAHPAVIANKGAAKVEEVIEHPVLDLLQQVNPTHNAFDLWEITQLYLEVHGVAYWLLSINDFTKTPESIWALPPYRVRPVRLNQSSQIVDYYEYNQLGNIQKFAPEQIIRFAIPDPKDPYLYGYSPLKACFEQVRLNSEYTAMKRAVYDNTGIPSVIVSPQETISDEEKTRLENEWSAKFRHGGQGKVLVTETATKIEVLSHSLGDLAALAEMKATKEDIANAFHVPMPYLSGDTNLANMQAAERFHMKLCIGPRLSRRDQKLNERLIPFYDTSGRLFFESDDPVKGNKEELHAQQIRDIRAGIKTRNEVRAERGLPPVDGGDAISPGYNG